MKTWELIKLAEDKCNFKVRMTNYKDLVKEYGYQVIDFPVVYEYGGRLSNENGNCLKMNFAILNSAEWELIRSPVTLAEAVKAYIDNKTIYCEVDNSTYTYKDFKGNEFNQMLCSGGAGISPQEILRGKWYIED